MKNSYGFITKLLPYSKKSDESLSEPLLQRQTDNSDRGSEAMEIKPIAPGYELTERHIRENKEHEEWIKQKESERKRKLLEKAIEEEQERLQKEANSSFHKAVIEGNLEELKKLFSKEERVQPYIFSLTDDGNSYCAMTVAAIENRPEIIDFLHQIGFDLSGYCKTIGQGALPPQPLEMACNFNGSEAVDKLLELHKKEDPNYKISARTLSYAADHPDLTRKLLEEVLKDGYLEDLKRGDIDDGYFGQFEVISKAAYQYQPETLTVLKEFGFNFGSRNESDETPIHILAKVINKDCRDPDDDFVNKAKRVIDYLIEAGVDPHAKAKYGMTAADFLNPKLDELKKLLNEAKRKLPEANQLKPLEVNSILSNGSVQVNSPRTQ